MSCWCSGACYVKGCSVYDGIRDINNPDGPLLPKGTKPSEEAMLRFGHLLEPIKHGNGVMRYSNAASTQSVTDEKAT